MPKKKESCPLSYEQVVDRYFLEHRTKLIDIAAFLDRADRAAKNNSTDKPAQPEDFRVAALRKALELVADGHPNRAKRVLELLSDTTQTPIDSVTPHAKGTYKHKGG